MKKEWAEVLSQEKARRTVSNQQKVAVWETQLQAMLEEQRSLRIAGRWIAGPRDLLSIVGQSRRETYHTAILGWLFDPIAPHGLGTSFLRWVLEEVLEETELSEEELLATETQCEVVQHRSRADIVLYTPGPTVIIEAKVDAIESERQCDILFEEWSAEEDPRFIFLSPTGRTPSTATGDAEDAFRTLGFDRILDVLRTLATSQASGSASGHVSLTSYLQTLEAEFDAT